MPGTRLTRREWLQRTAAMAAWGALIQRAPSYASPNAPGGYAEGLPALQPAASGERTVDLVIDALDVPIDGRVAHALAVNGTLPGPVVRFREGETAVLRVTNRLAEISSIHWHGILLPPGMDGVPGVSFGGITPGETFTYRFPVRQSGTYWAHSHSGGQELLGVYFPFIIDPLQSDPFAYDREYVVMLSDWSFERPETIIRKLKKQAGYYNFQKRTLADFARDVRENGWSATVKNRLAWSGMRMDPTDFADVTGYTYTYLLNGLSSEMNWTGAFAPGERIRLRFIDAGAMTFFDVRIPDLSMTVVQADGQNVQPVEVDEFRIGPGETLDVIVTPADRAYTVVAEAMDRSGFTRGTLTPRTGLSAPVPPRRPRPLRTMADMGMEGHGEGAHAANVAAMDLKGDEGHNLAAIEAEAQAAAKAREAIHDAAAHGTAPAAAMQGPALPGTLPVPHAPDTHGPANSSIAMMSRSRLDDPGSGFDTTSSRVLVYAQLRSVTPQPDQREPAREVELHITGNMERYMWSFDGKKYSEARAPIPFRYGERLRLVLVNDTMMEHPIHLHGMWMELENGAGPYQPRKHTVTVKPAERLTVAITADAPGQWAMHCHLLLHMEMGMFRVVEVSPTTEKQS